MREFLPFLILVFFVAIIGLSTYKINAKQNISATQDDINEEISLFSKTDITLPEFSLPNLYDENKSFTKNDLLGKYSVINFFASWCTTCRAEHEILMRLKYRNIADVYGIAWRDIRENTISYLQQDGNPFTVVASDSKAVFSNITGIKAVPETLIIDPEGKVIMRYQGNLQEFFIDELEQFIKNHS